MADPLTSKQAQILDKSKAAVQALLGDPVKKRYWKNDLPPEGADAPALAQFNASTLDEIWIYTNGRVHFSVDGIARKVDDKTRLDLPPPENMIA